jgi:hypothetical protein
MGVRTAERITGVSMRDLRGKQHYIGCGRLALRCGNAKALTQSARRRREDNAEAQSTLR